MSEIEIQSDVDKRQTAFIHTMALPRLFGVFQDIVDKRVNTPDLNVVEVFEDHFLEPKQFGAADKDRLMIDIELCLAFCRDKRIPKEFKADGFELSASMIWESAFIDTVDSHNAVDTVDERLELIDIGSSFLMHASTLTQKTDMEKTQRLLIKNLFTQAMRDIVAGEVTEATRQELLLSLRDARTQIKFIKDARIENGLLGEITALETFWNDYSKAGDKVALPATVRGGSGLFRKDETHDIDILRQRRDGSWVVLTPVEVKRQKITDEMKRRYTKSHLAEVAVDGTLTISGDHRQRAV